MDETTNGQRELAAQRQTVESVLEALALMDFPADDAWELQTEHLSYADADAEGLLTEAYRPLGCMTTPTLEDLGITRG